MKPSDPFTLLESGVLAALESYSNVHRGSGHKSILSTKLFEEARRIILQFTGKGSRTHVVIFSTPGGAEQLAGQIRGDELITLSSDDLGLPLGVRAMVIRKKALPGGAPPRSGGGTTKLISRDWVIWTSAPAKFEPGTPPVINVITFARALQIADRYGKDCFMKAGAPVPDVDDLLYRDDFEAYTGAELLQKLRDTRIGKDLEVPTMNGPAPAISLDSSASTPAMAPVWEVFRKTLQLSGEIRKEIVDEVRAICTDFLGIRLTGYKVIFTSNTTESINLLAGLFSTKTEAGEEPVIVGSLLEHSSNDLPWRSLDGNSLIRISVDENGFFSLAELENLLRDYNGEKKHGRQRIRMVALSGASNVLGACNHLADLGRLARSYGAYFMVDGAQLVAHRKIEMENTGIDFLAFSAHKAYAPFGCGVLVARKDLMRGAGEPDHYSGSEENTAGVAALGKALDLLRRIGMDAIEKEEKELTAGALKKLSGLRGLQLYGVSDPGSPEFARRLGVISFNLKNMVSFRIGKELAYRKGIGVRVGCHCAHITVKHILNVGSGLEKFQKILLTLIPSMSFPGVVRVSLGIENVPEDLDGLVEGLREVGLKENKAGTVSRSELKAQLKEFYQSRVEMVYGNI